MPVIAAGVMFGVEFGVDRSRDWKTLKPDWDREYGSRRPSVFQSTRWLTAWYEAFARQTDIEPLLLTVRNLQTGLVALRLPLLKRTVKGVCIVEFADLEVTPYNAPLLGPAAPRESEEVAAMWRDLRSALRRWDVDLVRLHKMPVDMSGISNPLVSSETALASTLNGYVVTVGDDIEAYRSSIRHMQLARSWRVFMRHPDAAFRIITDEEEALRVLGLMDEQQAKRNQSLGKPVMNATRLAFYRNLVASGINDGYVVMSALTSGDDVVAISIGIRQRAYYVVLRISHAGERWLNCSPGRLILDQTIAALHKEGVRQFDLGLGNDELKRRFGAADVLLTNITMGISWRGMLLVRVTKWARGHARLIGFLRRMLHQSHS